MFLNIPTYKKTFLLLIGVLLLNIHSIEAQEKITFSNLEEVLQKVKEKNYSFDQAEIQTQLGELNRKTAIANVINPRVPTSMQMIDNTKQQVLFLPGEVFGEPGTFRSVTTGQKFTSLISLQPQFEILNMAGIAQIKSAKINQELTANKNKINELNIYNQINPIYFNILSFKGQIEIVNENINSAESILNITKNRFKEDVARKQEVNEAEVNLINLQNHLEQLEFNLRIQENSLSLFFENSFETEIAETVWAYDNIAQAIETNNNLQVQNAEIQLKLMQQELKISKAMHWPTLSFVTSFNWQNLSSDFFYGSNSNSIDFNYVGLKLSMDLTSASKISNIRNKKFQSELLKISEQHSIKENETNNRQLVLDYEKSIRQLENFKKIVVLKEDTYNKSFLQYQENILSLDDLLISYNNMLSAKLNVVTALANIGFNKSKIDINNKF